MSSIPAPISEPPKSDPALPIDSDVALLRGVLDAAPSRVCVVSRDRRYLYVNREFCHFAQRPMEEILGMRTHDLIGETVATRLDPQGERALAGEVVHSEGWVDYPRIGRRYIAWTFTPFGLDAGRRDAFILYMRDQTEEKLREEEAEANRDRLRAILEGVADGVNIVGSDARLVLANAGFLRMFGFPAELGAAGTPLADFVRNRLRRADWRPDEDRCAQEEELIFRRVADIMTRKPGREEETRPDGSVIELRTQRLPDGTLVNTYSDLTIQREAERARRAGLDALRHNERLAAIASLLAGVAHEINNPLAVIAAQALLLAEEAEGTALADRAEKIRLAAERCGRIVTSLLASARQKPPKREMVDLRQAVATGLDLTADQAREAGIEVLTEIDPDLPAIRGDADQLAHLVGNLVGNARAALTGHGAPGADWQPRILLRLRALPDAVELLVADNGPGIPEGLRERVFDPFFTTKPDGQGTGVGLALCRTIAKAHGGSIGVAEASDGGAALLVRLPRPRS